MFRAPAAASLECCCFIDDKEFLSGSDDGSIELWSIMRKKPILIIKNAHPVSSTSLNSIDNDDESPKGMMPSSLMSARFSYSLGSVFISSSLLLLFVPYIFGILINALYLILQCRKWNT